MSLSTARYSCASSNVPQPCSRTLQPAPCATDSRSSALPGPLPAATHVTVTRWLLGMPRPLPGTTPAAGSTAKRVRLAAPPAAAAPAAGSETSCACHAASTRLGLVISSCSGRGAAGCTRPKSRLAGAAVRAGCSTVAASGRRCKHASKSGTTGNAGKASASGRREHPEWRPGVRCANKNGRHQAAKWWLVCPP